MRLIPIAPGEYYHLFNRGVNKQVIFHDNRDYARFLFLILYFQTEIKFPQVGRHIDKYVKSRAFDIEEVDEVVKNRKVELVSFCIMSDHFHLIIREISEGGISSYMQRVLTAYSKYYNTKYQKSGHVFQGPYRFIHVEDNEQLLYLSTYIHRNPREILKWLGKEDQYEWSSYQDFIIENRWRGLLLNDIVLGQFKSKEKYREFSNSSPAKAIQDELVSMTL
jgi:putative transposase